MISLKKGCRGYLNHSLLHPVHDPTLTLSFVSFASRHEISLPIWYTAAPRVYLPMSFGPPPLHYPLRSVYGPDVHFPTCSDRDPAADMLLFVWHQHPPPAHAFTPPTFRARYRRVRRLSFRASPSAVFPISARPLAHLTSSFPAWPLSGLVLLPPIPVQPPRSWTPPPRKMRRCTPSHRFVRGLGALSPPVLFPCVEQP